MSDPFAEFDQTEEPVVEPAQTESVWNNPKETVSVSDDNKVRITLKGGTGFDAPWITIDGGDILDAKQQMEGHAEALKSLIDTTAKIGAYFASKGGSKPSAGNGGGQAAPAQQQAPGGETRQCAHGEMKYMAGFSKSSGKPYKGFFCQERDRDRQCKPEFIR